MDAQEVLRDIGLILGAGLLAAPVATFLRLPVMLVLVAAGALIGPSALGLVENPLEGLGAELVFTLGVSLILFHGGLQISLRVISQTAFGLGMLVLPGVLITALIVAVVAAPVFSVPFTVALLLGSVLAATDPAILIPLFDRVRIRRKVSQTVVAESAFNDPTATMLALTVAAAVVSGGVTMSGTILDFGQSLALGALFGFGGGLLLAVMLSSHRIGIWRESPAVVVLALVSLEYFTAPGASGPEIDPAAEERPAVGLHLIHRAAELREQAVEPAGTEDLVGRRDVCRNPGPLVRHCLVDLDMKLHAVGDIADAEGLIRVCRRRREERRALREVERVLVPLEGRARPGETREDGIHEPGRGRVHGEHADLGQRASNHLCAE